MKFPATYLICLVFSAVSFAQTKCFENAGLKQSTGIEFTITGGGKVSGWYMENSDGGEDPKGYEFGGTRKGGSVTVTQFTDNKKPAWMPKGKSWIWTLIRMKSGAEILRVNIYGQNYETGKYSIYPVNFESCKSLLASREDTRRVSFARGSTEAKVSVTNNRQSFLINIRQGQFIGAVAFGYGVKIYYPNGDVYASAEEPGAIKNQTAALDFAGSDAAPASGDALILLEKETGGAGEAVFIVRNTARELEHAIKKIVGSR